jgi:hypothetical protein
MSSESRDSTGGGIAGGGVPGAPCASAKAPAPETLGSPYAEADEAAATPGTGAPPTPYAAAVETSFEES